MSSGQEVGDIFGEGTGPATSLLRSPTVLIASIGLFGMNVYFFKLFDIDYVRVLNLDLEKERMNNNNNNNKKRQSQKQLTSNNSNSNSTILLSSSTDSVYSDSANSVTTTTTTTIADESNSHLSSSSPDLVEMASLSGSSSSVSNGISAEAITAPKLLCLSASLMLLLHISSYLWITLLDGSPIGAIFLFYAFVAFLLFFPLSSTKWIRQAFSYVMGRIFELVNPRCSCFSSTDRPIPFMDVFVADGMCSLSKVFFDWGMLWHLASHYPEPVPPSAQSIIIPSVFASWPYIVRARQCLIMYSIGDAKTRYQHMLNAIKYSTSLFPLLVSAYQRTVDVAYAAYLDKVLIALLIINSVYSLAWDIIMDWGMMKNPKAVIEYSAGQCIGVSKPDGISMTCGQAFLRPKLRFGLFASLGILVMDSILRFSWTMRFFEGAIFSSNDAFILCTQFLEVFRRGIWNLLRVEWENIKQTMSSLSHQKKGINSFDEQDDERVSLVVGNGISMPSTKINNVSIEYIKK